MEARRQGGFASWWREWEAWALMALVLGVYFSRLTTQPIAGEESRWASAAAEMLRSGDWIVLRQQGQVFPERPPMTSWGMALVGLFRGGVDEVAVRLPSALAVLATTLLVYWYGRHFLSRLAALTAAAAFATGGQVLQLARTGESEAVFTFFLAASLLVWHGGYLRGWPRWQTWLAAYSLAALAALVKGPQAPVYLATATVAYLLLERRFRELFSWSHLTGLAGFAVLIAAWQIPYYLATDWVSVRDTWFGLASDRFYWRQLGEHMVSYPLETFACLLPWSPLCAALLLRPVREAFFRLNPATKFLLVAVAVTYPTVWLATGARGRYYMPLYPCLTLLLGWIVDCSASAEQNAPAWRPWRNFLLSGGVAMLAGAAVLAAAPFVPQAQAFAQSTGWTIALVALAVMGSAVLLLNRRLPPSFGPQWAVLSIAAVVGGIYTGAVVNVQTAQWTNVKTEVESVRSRLPEGVPLVSFGAINHRFAYHFGEHIEQFNWPLAATDIPDSVEYFCFTNTPGDTAERRVENPGRYHRIVPGHLPLDWELVAIASCERRRIENPQELVIVGRIRKPRVAQQTSTALPSLLRR